MGIAKALAAKNGYELDSNQEVCDFLLSSQELLFTYFLWTSMIYLVCCEIEQDLLFNVYELSDMFSPNICNLDSLHFKCSYLAHLTFSFSPLIPLLAECFFKSF